MTGHRESTVDFDGLLIGYDDRVLEPRAWTQAQSDWAAELLAFLPPGPVLELCAGAGQIGLLAVRRSDRRLVCVDADPTAVHYARANADHARMQDRVEVRRAPLERAIGEDEVFALVLADPPWVASAEVGTFPDDPVTAIDGGPEGLDVARSCLTVIGRHLAPQGCAILQLGSAGQVAALAPFLEAAGLQVLETRLHGGRGVLARLTLA